MSATRAFVAARWPEIIGLFLVLSMAMGVRLWRLGTVPRIIAGDETDTVQNALQINAGAGPGIFELDWSQSPAAGVYPLAWIIRIFGDSVTDVRLYVVFFSMLAILLMYLAAREVMGVLPALAAASLMATNVWFLNFSRTLWYTTNSAFIAIGACWAVTRALKSEGRKRWMWWAITAGFTTMGLYGYSSARFVCLSVAVCAAVAVVARFAPLRQTAIGLAAAAVVSAVLFAPMAKYIHDNFEYFQNRMNTVSVFKVVNSDGTKANGWKVAWDSVEPNVRGLILNDKHETNRGPYNARYHPFDRSALEIFGAILFLLGLVIAAVRWRQTYTWFPFIIPAAIANLFSTFTPDYARSIVLAPFYFLFIGLAFDQLMSVRQRFAPWPVLAAAVVAVTAFISVREVKLYFDWQSRPGTQSVRAPGVDYCEWDAFISGSKKSAANGAKNGIQQGIDLNEFLARRQLNQCSPILRLRGEYNPTPAPAASPSPQPTPTVVAPTPTAAAATPAP